MPSPFLTALLCLGLLLGGCFLEPGPSFVETSPLPTPEALLAEYGALPPGTFTLRRYEVARDTGRVFTGTALADLVRPNGPPLICLRGEHSAAATFSTRDPESLALGSNQNLNINVFVDGHELAEGFVFLSDTSDSHINGVFAFRTFVYLYGGDRFYKSIMRGRFSAAMADLPLTSC